MDWLVFAFALELGAIRGPEFPVDTSSYVQTEAALIAWKHLEVSGVLRSYQVPVDYRWAPFRMDYTTAVTVKFGALSFGVEHLCYHPVDTPWPGQPEAIESGGHERAFLRIATPRTRW